MAEPPPKTGFRIEDFDDSKSSFQRDAEGMLKREHFTAERVAYLTEQVSKTGLWTFISQEERDASRRAALSSHAPGTDLWIFGYGSLMWNPALNVTESRKALVRGYTRSFCLQLIIGRAMPDAPGLMLAIEPGDALTGVVHRIDSDAVEAETEVLWMREMMSGAYTPVWVKAETDNGPVDAVTFMINKAHNRYSGALPVEEQAARIARAEGQAGNNRDYLYRCRRELLSMGVTDPYVEALFSAVCKITGEPGEPLPFKGNAS
jgi:cation transport protein ChaC